MAIINMPLSFGGGGIKYAQGHDIRNNAGYYAVSGLDFTPILVYAGRYPNPSGDETCLLMQLTENGEIRGLYVRSNGPYTLNSSYNGITADGFFFESVPYEVYWCALGI